MAQTPNSKVVVGITGTNGKSTATNYFAQLMERAGKATIACGNFGYPFASAAVDARNFECFSLELSSYQLETTVSLRPQASVLLNLQNDHLLRYGTLDEYLKAKWRLLLLTADTGVAVLDRAVLAHALRLGLPLPRCQVVLLEPHATTENADSKTCQTLVAEQGRLPAALCAAWKKAVELPVSLYSELTTLEATAHFPGVPFGVARYHWQHAGPLQVNVHLPAQGVSLTHAIQKPCLPGEHNAHNLLAVSVVALALGVPAEVVWAQWEDTSTTYVHLPHRLERVGGAQARFFVSPTGQKEKDGEAPTEKRVQMVNDSKATNVESTLVALRSYAQGVRLLVGGEPKGESFLPLARFFKQPIERIYPFGKAGPQIARELGGVEATRVAVPCATLLEAAALALRDASADGGEVILLSPACASFDEFKNFEHRGDTFRTWALAQLARG